MTIFLIQTEKGKIVHDFAFALERAVDYYREFLEDEYYDIVYFDHDRKIDNSFIPIGSVEFVHNFMRGLGVKTPAPVNIPMELRAKEFMGRLHATLGTPEDNFRLSDMAEEGWYFKSATVVKGVSGIVEKETRVPKGVYHLTEPIGIKAEFRVFVMNGEVVGCHRYAGNWYDVPERSSVLRMIRAYTDSPSVYTLDVAVTDKDETVIMECHHFYSCGLYGFADYKNLPIMFARWWIENVTNRVKWSKENEGQK